MSEARAQILSGIRKSLGRGALDEERRAEVDRRLSNPTANLIPKRAQIDHDAQLSLFVSMAEESAASVGRVARIDDVPAAVATYLANENLPSEIAAAPGLRDVPWQNRPLITVRFGGTDGEDEVGVAPAFAGIAESGTLMLHSGPDSPSLLNFLPETQIVLLQADRVTGAYEQAWTALRAAGGSAEDTGFMPRTVNFITGPSRSGDIEHKLQMGAHGPRRLHIILVDEALA